MRSGESIIPHRLPDASFTRPDNLVAPGIRTTLLLLIRHICDEQLASHLIPRAFTSALSYLSDYKSLAEQLVKLHTYAIVPSVLLIDHLDNYLGDEAAGNDASAHIARTCALIHHSMKSCARALKINVSETAHMRDKKQRVCFSKRRNPRSAVRYVSLEFDRNC